MGIAWSCLIVIFACTWKAVHPDVPPTHLGGSMWKLFSRRLCLTLWTLFVPELAIKRAATQRIQAQVVSAAYRKEHPKAGEDSKADRDSKDSKADQDSEASVSESEHGNLLDMAESGTEETKAIQPKLQSCMARCMARLRALTALYKALVNRTHTPKEKTPWTEVHSFFFIMGGFGMSIPVTGTGLTPSDDNTTVEEDVFAIHPADITGLMPSNADKATMPWPKVKEAEITDKSKSDMITKALVVWQSAWFVIQVAARVVEGLAITELEIMTLAYGVMCACLYWLWWHKPYDVQKPIPITFQPEKQVLDIVMDPTKRRLNTQNLVLGTWINRLDDIIFEHPDFDLLPEDQMMSPYIYFMASATLFGCIHCIAWNFQFHTPLERLLWNSSALAVATMPLLVFIGFVCFAALRFSLDDLKIKDIGTLQNTYHNQPKWVKATFVFLYSASTIIYFLARIILIFQAFILLRDLSPSATQPISWSRLIPHV